MPDERVIRCRKCGNVICVRRGNEITVRKHGRVVSGIVVTEQYPIHIGCEQCQHTNTIREVADESNKG